MIITFRACEAQLEAVENLMSFTFPEVITVPCEEAAFELGIFSSFEFEVDRGVEDVVEITHTRRVWLTLN